MGTVLAYVAVVSPLLTRNGLLASYSPDQIAAFWTGIGALAAVCASAIAFFSLRALVRDSRDRTRPMMVAELSRAPLVSGTSELLVYNAGQSVAKDVRVVFDPPLRVLSPKDALGKVQPFLQRRYASPLATVVPRQQLRNVYTVGVDRGGPTRENDEPVPEAFSLTFKYLDERGRQYEDTYHLDVETLSGHTESSPSGGPESYPKRTVKALEAIAKAATRLGDRAH